MLNYGILSPSNRVSIVNYMWVWQCVLFGISHSTGSCFGYPKQIKGQPRRELVYMYIYIYVYIYIYI